MNKDYIAHHGIEGQRWGVRRFQNEDGTLTEAGKRRYRQLGESISRNTAKAEQYAYKNTKAETRRVRLEGKAAKYSSRVMGDLNRQMARHMSGKRATGGFRRDVRRSERYTRRLNRVNRGLSRRMNSIRRLGERNDRLAQEMERLTARVSDQYIDELRKKSN